MGWDIPDNERSHLRELAQRQAEYAALPVMAERRQMWYDVNDARPGARPPFVIECWFDGEFIPQEILRCKTELGRKIEHQLLAQIRNHELIDDDKVIRDTFDIGWLLDRNEFGVEVTCEHAKNTDGRDAGFKYHHVITDLKRDLVKLKPVNCRVDKAKTFAWQAFLEDVFDNALPVEIRIDSPASSVLGWGPFLTYRLVNLMSMEDYYLAMYDSPNELHQLMAFLRDNALKVMRWAEQEQLLRLNNGNQITGFGSPSFTKRLPADNYDGENVRLCDIWGKTNSQETIGVSPALFREFCLPYYKDVCEPMGLVYYGCCEPAHPFWEEIRQLPHLKKVSISRWCDQDFMADALRGTEIVFSRKPDPNLLCVDKTLNEAAWTAHIRETLEATGGVFVEFVMRDVTTVHGDLNKVRRAVEIARREIDRCF